MTAAPIPSIPFRPTPSADGVSRRDHACITLRRWILDGRLAPGERVQERDLALALGISTTPVKEALRRLELEGLVVSVPRNGTVISFDPAQALEMMTIRAALESVSARLAAEKLTPPGAVELGACLTRMERLTAAGDRDGLIAANADFHDVIRTIAANPYLSTLLDGLRAYDMVLRAQVLSTPDELDRALADHRGVVAAILARDPTAAEAAMRSHVLRSAARLTDARAAAPAAAPQSRGAR